MMKSVERVGLALMLCSINIMLCSILYYFAINQDGMEGKRIFLAIIIWGIGFVIFTIREHE